MRFLAVLGSGTRVNQMLGPPHPAASTNALSRVDSSSTSDPNTAAQNVASASASAASKETVLITDAIPGDGTGGKMAGHLINRAATVVGPADAGHGGGHGRPDSRRLSAAY